MTTDPEEGRQQIATMLPEPIKVGDKVRLAAGMKPMTVVAVEDYGNKIVCEWEETQRDTFPARALVPAE